jgi:hypothetical protein
MPKKIATDSPDRIAATILFVRGQRVMLDTDLANLYGVTTKVLLQAVRRNIQRFPEDFCFQLPADDWSNLRSQIVTSRSGYGGRRYTPYAFTEQGVAMHVKTIARVAQDLRQVPGSAAPRSPTPRPEPVAGAA